MTKFKDKDIDYGQAASIYATMLREGIVSDRKLRLMIADTLDELARVVGEYEKEEKLQGSS